MRVLVTGGGGFLGQAIVRDLLARGHRVTSASRSSYLELNKMGAQQVPLDLGDAEAVFDALEGFEAVVHCAAKTGIWGPQADYQRVNVDGTHHVVEACLRHGIERLVYTSSPSVCFDGKDHLDAKNDLPYPKRHLCAYAETKAAAERLALGANKHAGLSTCALRPHLIFGPGDPHLIPRLLERGRARKLAKVGSGKNRVSMTFVENAAAAHGDALEALGPDADHAGRAYFIAQKDSVNLWDWVDELFAALGLPPIKRRIPLFAARGLGALCELFWNLTKRQGEPPMTRFVALQLATSHSYDLTPAERDFGYTERVSMQAAMQRTLADLDRDSP